MPLFLILIGIILIVSGAKGTTRELAELLKEDFQPTDGSASFGAWIVALASIGALGYASKLKPLSNALLLLVFVVMMLSNKGFFSQFTTALNIKV